MSQTQASLARRLREAGLPNADALAALALPSCRVIARARPLEALALGASRFGGAPDLPDGFEWPQHRGRPITFLAQFDLAELSLPTLPATGWLLFFYDAAEQPWGFDPLHRGGARVIYVDCPRESLSRSLHPDVTSAGGPYEPCELVFRRTLELPSRLDAVLGAAGLELLPEHLEAYERVSLELQERHETEPYHHLLGHPQLLRGDVRGECQLVSNGIYCGDASGYQSKGAAELLATAPQQWQLLLQLDSDPTGPDFCWAEDGRLYFCIRPSDLASLAFEQAWLVLQTVFV